MRFLARFLAGAGLALAALVLPQSPAMAIATESVSRPCDNPQTPEERDKCRQLELYEYDRRMGRSFT
jgi:uncharacterized protein